MDSTKGRLLFLTGLSGAGRSTTLKTFEDLGYRIIDNLPPFLLSRLDEAILNHEVPLPLVVGFEVRTYERDIETMYQSLQAIKKRHAAQLIFLTCQENVLVTRYNTTRRRHPMPEHQLRDAIQHEQKILNLLRPLADHEIDTSGISVVMLRRVLQKVFHVTPKQSDINVRLISFSYRFGLPADADIVFDVRFLENPSYEESLKTLTGQDDAVARFISQDKKWNAFFEILKKLLDLAMQGYLNSGRSYLTVAIGCTGGQHRSVFVVEKMLEYLTTDHHSIEIEHRELGISHHVTSTS